MVPGNRYDILDMAEISFVYNNNVQYQYQAQVLGTGIVLVVWLRYPGTVVLPGTRYPKPVALSYR